MKALIIHSKDDRSLYQPDFIYPTGSLFLYLFSLTFLDSGPEGGQSPVAMEIFRAFVSVCPSIHPHSRAPEPARQASASQSGFRASQASELGRQASEPGSHASEPGSQASEPASQASEPASQALEPASQASEPATQA